MYCAEMGKTQSQSRIGVWRFLSDSEWSRSAFFVNLWSRGHVLNFKIETKDDASVKCDFGVNNVFPNFEKFGIGV